MTNYTPGPWEIAPYNGENIRFIVAGEDCLVADCWPSVDPYYRNANDRRYKSRRKPNEADARLIAAAPDLLAALQACDEAMEYMSEYDIPLNLLGQVKAAIKKATGEIDETL